MEAVLEVNPEQSYLIAARREYILIMQLPCQLLNVRKMVETLD